jgi:hypothetical protein
MDPSMPFVLAALDKADQILTAELFATIAGLALAAAAFSHSAMGALESESRAKGAAGEWAKGQVLQAQAQKLRGAGAKFLAAFFSLTFGLLLVLGHDTAGSEGFEELVEDNQDVWAGLVGGSEAVSAGGLLVVGFYFLGLGARVLQKEFQVSTQPPTRGAEESQSGIGGSTEADGTNGDK